MPENENTGQRSPDYLSEIIKAISSAPPPRESAQSTASAEKSENQSPVGGGDLLTSLLSNPELMTKLPTIIAAIKPFMEMMSAKTEVQPESVPTFSPQQNRLPSPAHKSEGDSRTALLCAMKPYLGDDRRQAIDYIVKLGRLGDILKTL